MIKDGWHTICGNRILVQDGFIRYGVEGEGFAFRMSYACRYLKHIGWVRTVNLTPAAFRSGIKRGTIKMKY